MLMLADIPLRLIALFFAVLVYGCFGSPTPQNFGLVEAIVGGLLILSINPATVLRRVSGQDTIESGMVAAIFLLVYGLTVPLCGGFLAGNAPGLILRDIIPFLFMLLPVFIVSPSGVSFPHIRIFTIVLTLAGVLFSMRVVLPPVLGIAAGPDTGEGAKYLSISPLVVFSALTLILQAGYILYARFTALRMAYALGLLSLSVFPFLAMMMTVQRASLGLMIVAIMTVAAVAFIRNPLRTLGPVLVLGGTIIVFGWGSFAGMIETLLQKQNLVGMNMRGQEAAAIMHAVSGSVWSALFGNGWGAVFVSPAVGETEVGYSHSLLTYSILKMGMVGMGLVAVWLTLLFRALCRAIRQNPLFVASVSVPVFIDIFLYASYKSLDFGLILLLAGWLGALGMVHGKDMAAQLRPRPSSCIP